MIRFAIVGCGHIAKKHAEAINNVDGAILTAVCDTVEERMQPYIEQYGANGYTDLTELFLDKNVDVVAICTPSGYHRTIAVQAAEAGKHVVVEKPIALTLQDADAIIEACERNRVKLSVVHPNRFRPAVVALKNAMEDGLFGKLSHVNATVRWNRNQAYYDQAAWRGTKTLDGGVLMNQAIHNLDLLLWLAGPVTEVQAYTATRLRQIEAEDVASAIVRFENGALGIIEAAATIYPKNLEESLSIFGESGSAIIGGGTANWIKHWSFASVGEEESQQLIDRILKNPYGISGHQYIIADMVEAIKLEKRPIVTGEDGRNVLKLVLAIYEAAEKEKNVSLL